MNKLAKRIGSRIVKLRTNEKLTQEKLAYEIGMSKGYLSDIEKGNKLPSLTVLEQIADRLGVDIKEMF